jgi:hypothetical protein
VRPSWPPTTRDAIIDRLVAPVLDAYGRGLDQDFLLVSSTDRPVIHHLFCPKDLQQRRA